MSEASGEESATRVPPRARGGSDGSRSQSDSVIVTVRATLPPPECEVLWDTHCVYGV